MLKLAGELIEGQLADHIARLDAHTYEAFSILRTGEYYVGYMVGNTISISVTVNRLIAVPLIVSRDMTVDRICIYVQVAGAAGKKARLGIYNNGTNLYPGTLLLDAGEVAIDSTGIKAITINQALTKGVYWLAIVCNDGNLDIKGIANIFLAPPLSIHDVYHHVSNGQWYVAHSYAALPDPFTAGGTLTYGSFLVPVRVASLD